MWRPPLGGQVRLKPDTTSRRQLSLFRVFEIGVPAVAEHFLPHLLHQLGVGRVIGLREQGGHQVGRQLRLGRRGRAALGVQHFREEPAGGPVRPEVEPPAVMAPLVSVSTGPLVGVNVPPSVPLPSEVIE